MVSDELGQSGRRMSSGSSLERHEIFYGIGNFLYSTEFH